MRISSRCSVATALGIGVLLSWALAAHAGDAHEVDARLPSGSKFSVSMPVAGWNGALIEARCGTECQAPEGLCSSIVARGYACVAGASASDFHSVAEAHEMLLMAKAIVAGHFRKPPESSVLLACGRSAGAGLWQAEAFPGDFQGIVAGAPILDDDAHRGRLRWLGKTLRSTRGGPLLTRADLAQLHTHALASCDANDGLEDGLISDPLRCRVRPEALQCANAGDGSSATRCLRPKQIEAIQRVYAGPADRPDAGQLPGSELGWGSLHATPARGPVRSSAVDRAQPDLSRFVASGGKLLLFQGLADTQVAPRQTAEMYERWAMALGGRVTSTAHVRLFMVPGLQHCGGGEGPYQIDFLRGIENWVVKAKRAPDDFIAFHPRTEFAGLVSLFAPTAKDPAQQVFSSWQVGVTTTLPESRHQPQTRFSRPIYLYPVHTHYKGMGDPDVWRSFYGPNDYPWLLK